MLHKLTISNFLSFAEPETFDLSVPGRTPEHRFVANSKFGRFSKCAVFFGNNGSGKTNVLKAISFLDFLLRQSARALEEGQRLPFFPFFPSSDERANRTQIEAVFSDEVSVYKYHVSFSQYEIFEESLSKKVKRHFIPLFERIYDKLVIDENWGITPLALSAFQFQKNATFISILAVTGEKNIRSLLDGPLNIYADVHSYWRNPYTPWRSEAATKYYSRNEKSRELLKMLLSEFDVGVTDVEFFNIDDLSESDNFAYELILAGYRPSRARRGETEEHKVPIFVHGASGRLPLHAESEGTQNLYNYLYRIFAVLQSGGIAVLDEFDGSVHPANIGKIIDLFRDKDTNPRNSQLIMAVHTASLLQELEKEEIFFCHKDNEGRTHIYGLKDISDVRRIDNYYAKYLAGYYGAIPHSHIPKERIEDKRDRE